MTEFQERVVKEKAELDELRLRLGSFLRTSTFANLHPAEKARMYRQASAMDDYSKVLGERIDNFKET